MGAESLTHLIFFIAAVIVATAVVGVVYTNVTAVASAAHAGGSTLSQQLKTDITIINDPGNINYSAGAYIFYVKNTGKSNLDPGLVTVLINGVVVSPGNISIVGGGSTVWRPVDVLQINVTAIPAGDNNIRVVTENGIEDAMDFHI